jgi:hypothetical protein
MIEIIFSYLNRVKKQINSLISERSSDMYGTGELGNVYYGITNDQIPDFINFDKTIISPESSMPLVRPAHYKNLYIDEGVTLKSPGDWATILVQDTLYLRGNIDISNTHKGNYEKTSIVPDKLTRLLMYGETNYLVNEPFFITGGSNNPCFGNSNVGGGFTAIYYGNAYALTDTDKKGSVVSNLSTNVNVSGGSGNENTSGGCLIIAARNIVLTPSSRILNYGGDGSGTTALGIFCQYQMNN